MTKEKILSKAADYIVYENDDFMALNKPPHISSLMERNNQLAISMQEIAKHLHADAQLCHRLDKETSGVLLVAKNPEAYRYASMSFEHRKVTKVYHAVVHGIQDFEGIQVLLPILPLNNGTVTIDKVAGKDAETIFNTIDVYRHHTLVECLPITGRMHQIRIHLSCLKSPIVMDFTYGGKEILLSGIKKKFNLKQEQEEQPLISRVALHAHTLHFAVTEGNYQALHAPYPKDFKALVNQLEKNR